MVKIFLIAIALVLIGYQARAHEFEIRPPMVGFHEGHEWGHHGGRHEWRQGDDDDLGRRHRGGHHHHRHDWDNED